jgi:hypothetical protein
MANSLDDLAARLRVLEDERDIRNTLERYGFSLDYGREADWVDCFTPDGIYDFHYREPATKDDIAKAFPMAEIHDKGVRFQGRDVLARFASLHTRAPAYIHKHVVGDIVITRGADPDRASVVSYYMRLDDIENRRVITAFGRYFDKMLRCADGRWRFVERLVELESMERRVAGDK